jgi:hypothetical protein
MRVSRLWRDIQARKRFGFGHGESDDSGLGSLALFCPACPQPGVNLPEDWMDSAEPYVPLISSESYLIFIQLAISSEHCR